MVAADTAGPLPPPSGPGLAVLGRAACLDLLARTAIGRLAVTVGTTPAVFPVNYALLDGDIVIRTAAGTKLHAATRGVDVAFEIDGFDPLYHTGWSVVVVGPADEVTDPGRLARARHLALRPWAEGHRDHLLRIRTETVTGRRLTHWDGVGPDEPAPD